MRRESKDVASLTFVAAGQAKGGQGTDDSKDVMRQNSSHFSKCSVRSQQCQIRAGASYDELLLRARELTEDRLDDIVRRLDRQRI